jgi:hypothetical protein
MPRSAAIFLLGARAGAMVMISHWRSVSPATCPAAVLGFHHNLVSQKVAPSLQDGKAQPQAEAAFTRVVAELIVVLEKVRSRVTRAPRLSAAKDTTKRDTVAELFCVRC